MVQLNRTGQRRVYQPVVHDALAELLNKRLKEADRKDAIAYAKERAIAKIKEKVQRAEAAARARKAAERAEELAPEARSQALAEPPIVDITPALETIKGRPAALPAPGPRGAP